MAAVSTTRSPSDPFDLARFVEAQAESYDRALAEIRGGRKRSHWIEKYFRGERDGATLRLLGDPK